MIRARVEDPLSGASAVTGQSGCGRLEAATASRRSPPKRPHPGCNARWNSYAYPPGAYEFRAVASDAAGNVATSTSRADGGAMILSNPIKAPSVLVAGFGGRQWPRTRTLPYGRGIRFSGRLTTGSRRPIEGASVRVVERYPGHGADRWSDGHGRGWRLHASAPRRAEPRTARLLRRKPRIRRLIRATSATAGPKRRRVARLRAGGDGRRAAGGLPGAREKRARSCPRMGSRSTCSSESRASPGRSSGRFRPIGAGGSATPTASATTTVAASGSSFELMRPRRATGRMSPGDSRPVAVRGR